MCNNTENKLYRPIKLIGNYWLAGIAIILLIFSIGIHFKSIEYYDSALMLGFIGILATFIVVGNYAQVMTIRDDSKETIRETKDEISKAIEEMRADFDNRIKTANEKNDELTITINNSISNLKNLNECTQSYLQGLVFLSTATDSSILIGLKILTNTALKSIETYQTQLFIDSLSLIHLNVNIPNFINFFITQKLAFEKIKEFISINLKNSTQEVQIDEILYKIDRAIQSKVF